MKKTVTIKENRTFRRIYSKGRSAVTPFLVLYCRPNRLDHNRLGVTVDYLLADSVSDSDANILEQFKQVIDQQPLERKQMAINVLRTIFSYFDDTEGA